MLLGLVRPTGHGDHRRAPYADLDRPLAVVGAALEATNVHPGRTGRDHLRAIAAASWHPGLPGRRAARDAGIPACGKRAGGYSTGYAAAARARRRRCWATRGADPRRARQRPRPRGHPLAAWLPAPPVRDQGKTVLVSSHLLQEVEQTVDDVVIISNGTLVKQGAMADLRRSSRRRRAYLGPTAALAPLRWPTWAPSRARTARCSPHSTDLQAIGDAALAAGLPVWELRRREPTSRRCSSSSPRAQPQPRGGGVTSVDSGSGQVGAAASSSPPGCGGGWPSASSSPAPASRCCSASCSLRELSTVG